MASPKIFRRHISDSESLQMEMSPGDDHEHLAFGTVPFGPQNIFDPNSAYSLFDSLEYFDHNSFWVKPDGDDFRELYKI